MAQPFSDVTTKLIKITFEILRGKQQFEKLKSATVTEHICNLSGLTQIHFDDQPEAWQMLL